MGKKITSTEKIILGIDTSTQALVICLGTEHKLIGSFFELIDRVHLERSMLEIGNLLKRTNIDLKNIGAIVVGLGPGSLIGSRVGVVIAKTLAQVLKISVIGISTLDVIACSDNEGGKKAVVNNAFKNELYWAVYENCKRISDYKVSNLDDFREEIANLDILFTGTALEQYAEYVEKWPNVVLGKVLFPSPQGLLKAGIRELGESNESNYVSLEPIYLRGPV